jgi:hypothetical protein
VLPQQEKPQKVTKKPAASGLFDRVDDLSGHVYRNERQQKHHQRTYHGQHHGHERNNRFHGIVGLVFAVVVMAGHGVLRKSAG